MTFPDPEVSAYIRERFTPVLINAAAEPVTFRHFGARGTPVNFILDDEGDVRMDATGRKPLFLAGSAKPADYLEWLKEAAAAAAAPAAESADK